MTVFPGYTLESIGRLTLLQYRALHEIAAEILREKAKAMTL